MLPATVPTVPCMPELRVATSDVICCGCGKAPDDVPAGTRRWLVLFAAGRNMLACSAECLKNAVDGLAQMKAIDAVPAGEPA